MIPSKHIGIISTPKGGSFQQFNFNSLTASNKDSVNLGNTVFSNIRTVSFWFKPTINITSGSSQEVMLSRFDPPGTVNGRVEFTFFMGKILCNFYTGQTFANFVSDSDSWNAGVWYHVAVTIDAVNGTSMFVDSVKQINTVPANKNATHVFAGRETFLGGRVSNGNPYARFTMKNLQVWDTARTIGELIIDKNTYYPTGTTNLKETWHFRNETGLTVTGENGNNGTISTLNAGGVAYVNSTMREII